MSAILLGRELLEQTLTQADSNIKDDSHRIQMHKVILGTRQLELDKHFVFCAGPQVFSLCVSNLVPFHKTLTIFNKTQCDYQP